MTKNLRRKLFLLFLVTLGPAVAAGTYHLLSLLW